MPKTHYFSSYDFNFSRDLIDWYEYGLLIPYLVLFLLIAYNIRNKYFSNFKGKKYFIPALLLKLFGGLAICLIYNYYYGGGDTTAYFNDARLLNKVLLNDTNTAFRLYFSPSRGYDLDLYYFFHQFRFIRAEDTFLVVKIVAFLQLFTFNSFLVTSALFGFLSFFCLWYFYYSFCKLYPQLINQIALVTLFVPSLAIWGSGIFKDTICLSLLVLIIVLIQKLVTTKKSKTQLISLIVFFSYLIMIIKAYIILIFGLSVAIFFVLAWIGAINNTVIRLIATPLIICIGFLGFFLLFQKVGETKWIYSMDHILERVEITAHYLSYISVRDDASGYTLGDVEYTPLGILKKFPTGINVTLFRPYLWEVKKPIMLFSALESFAVLIFTIIIVIKTGILKAFSIISGDIIIFTFMTYSLLFSFAIGISTYNFGTLVRYKIPILPFYLIALILINHHAKYKKNTL